MFSRATRMVILVLGLTILPTLTLAQTGGRDTTGSMPRTGDARTEVRSEDRGFNPGWLGLLGLIGLLGLRKQREHGIRHVDSNLHSQNARPA